MQCKCEQQTRMRARVQIGNSQVPRSGDTEDTTKTDEHLRSIMDRFIGPRWGYSTKIARIASQHHERYELKLSQALKGGVSKV